jgi:shikimate kinase
VCWYAVGAAAAFAAGLLWRTRVYPERFPPAGFIVTGVVGTVIACIALLSMLRAGVARGRLWWAALALASAEWVVHAFRHGIHGDDLLDAMVVVGAAVGTLLLWRGGVAGGASPEAPGAVVSGDSGKRPSI